MAYSPIEQRYIDMVVEGYFPAMPTEPAPAAEEASLEGVQLVAGPSKTRTDAPAGAGLPKAPTTPDEAAELMRRMPLATQSEMIMRRIAEDQKAGVVGAVIPKDMTLREKLAAGMQQMLIDNAGMDNARARRLAQTMFGGESSGAPLGIGLIDITPAVIPLATEEAGISAGEARESAIVGDYGTAALKYGTGVLQGLDVVPGIAMAKTGAKAVGKALEPVAGEMLESYLTKTGAILKMAPDSPGIEVPAAPKPSTPAFKKWFGDSKVVDEKGQPLVVYHGTDQSFDEFRGNAYFTPVPDDASKYSYVNTPGKEHSPNVVPVYLNLQKPKTIKTYATRADIDDAKAAGFDGVIVQGVGGSKINHYIVFESTQIKSLFNKGTFDPKDPRILHGGGAAATGAATQGEEKK